MLKRLARPDVPDPVPDHDAELRLVIYLIAHCWTENNISGTDDRRSRLEENDRRFRDRYPEFARMVPVVEPDRDDLRRNAGRQELHFRLGMAGCKRFKRTEKIAVQLDHFIVVQNAERDRKSVV